MVEAFAEAFAEILGAVPVTPEQHLVEVWLLPADADEGEQCAAHLVGGRQGGIRPQGVHPVGDPFPALGGERGQ